MRGASAAFLSTISLDNFVRADLWTFELAAGTQYWTDAGVDVVIGATTWTHTGPVLRRGTESDRSGTEVSTLDVTLQGQYMVGGVTIAALAATGGFDNVKVTRERLCLPSWQVAPDVDHKLLLFVGHVYDLDPSSLQVKLVIKSLLARADEEVPRRMAGPMCPWLWGSPRCGINTSLWQASDTVAGGSTTQSIVLTTGTSAYLIPGATMQFSDGTKRTIRSWTAGTKTAVLDAALPQVPTGAVTIWRGCDKTFATCSSPFANLAMHGGFPAVPWNK